MYCLSISLLKYPGAKLNYVLTKKNVIQKLKRHLVYMAEKNYSLKKVCKKHETL